MIDKNDQIILDELKDDGSLSTYKISKKTGIPQTTVLNRIRKLIELKIIKKYSIEIDHKKLGKNVKALIFAKVNKEAERKKHGNIGDLESKLLKYDLIINVKRLMGKNDFVIEVIAENVEELNHFLIKKIRMLDEISETETIIILDEWSK